MTNAQTDVGIHDRLHGIGDVGRIEIFDRTSVLTRVLQRKGDGERIVGNQFVRHDKYP